MRRTGRGGGSGGGSGGGGVTAAAAAAAAAPPAACGLQHSHLGRNPLGIHWCAAVRRGGNLGTFFYLGTFCGF